MGGKWLANRILSGSRNRWSSHQLRPPAATVSGSKRNFIQWSKSKALKQSAVAVESKRNIPLGMVGVLTHNQVAPEDPQAQSTKQYYSVDDYSAM